jgi:hypothetical protein
MDGGAEQAIEQHVAVAAIFLVIARHHASKDQFAGKACSRRCGSAEARMV